MSDINIHGVPAAPGGYSLTGKVIMVHDEAAPLGISTVMVDATSFGGSGNSYSAPMWKETDGDLVAGLTTFTSASLINASEINFIIVNKNIEFIGDDYTFDPITGTIDRSPNIWIAGDKMVTPHKPG